MGILELLFTEHEMPLKDYWCCRDGRVAFGEPISEKTYELTRTVGKLFFSCTLSNMVCHKMP